MHNNEKKEDYLKCDFLIIRIFIQFKPEELHDHDNKTLFVFLFKFWGATTEFT